MDNLYGLTFLETIEPTYANAGEIQELTLQDVRAAGFPDPLSMANSGDPEMVAAQVKKLEDNPGAYCGFAEGRVLVAYMKCGPWLVRNELPYASGIRALWLRARMWLGRFGVSQDTGQLGVFGLVVSNRYNRHIRQGVCQDLLERAVEAVGLGVVNIIVHDNDPAYDVVSGMGLPVGPKVEADGAPGLRQQRFQI